MDQFKGTTILCVRRNNSVVIGVDGQVTLGNVILKSNAVKIRKIFKNKIIAGFAGSSADSLTLFEKFEEKLHIYHGNLTRAVVELGKYWRSDNILRRLEALLIVSDIEKSFLLSGNGDIIEPEDSILAIGSGGQFAQSAAIALFDNTTFSAKDIVSLSLTISAKICIYTNNNITIEELNKV